MPYNNINAQLDDTRLQQFITDLKSMQDGMPFLVNLTPKERQAGSKGQDKLAFVKAAYSYATNNPQLIPATLQIAEWENDINLLAQLTQLLQNINVLQEALKDTMLALRIESQTGALQFYNYAKIAAKSQVAGVDVIVDDLKKKLS